MTPPAWNTSKPPAHAASKTREIAQNDSSLKFRSPGWLSQRPCRPSILLIYSSYSEPGPSAEDCKLTGLAS